MQKLYEFHEFFCFRRRRAEGSRELRVIRAFKTVHGGIGDLTLHLQGQFNLLGPLYNDKYIAIVRHLVGLQLNET